jgi:hypothetical protein
MLASSDLSVRRGLSKIALNAGLSVSEVKAEISVLMAMVTANLFVKLARQAWNESNGKHGAEHKGNGDDRP